MNTTLNTSSSVIKKPSHGHLRQEIQPYDGVLENTIGIKRKSRHPSADDDTYWQRFERKQRLIDACEKHKHSVFGSLDLKFALMKCHQSVSFLSGVPKMNYRFCRQKGCPFCGAYKRFQERRTLLPLINKEVDAGKCLSFITLTIKGDAKESALNARLRLSKVWTKFWSNQNNKQYIEGGYKVIEVVKNNDCYHYHIHLLCVIVEGYTHTTVKSRLGLAWRKAGGGFTTFKRKDKLIQQYSKGAGNLAYELTSYATKENTELDERSWVEIAVAGKGKRDFSYVGTWRALKKEVLETLKEIQSSSETTDLPEFPSPINNKTGEMAYLPDGFYSVVELLKRRRQGCWSSNWALRALDYSMKHSNHPDFLDKLEELSQLMKWNGSFSEYKHNACRIAYI